MSSSVIPLRFINTPTALAIYEETMGSDELGISDDKVDELSKEYNQVTGNEAYYQLLFSRLNNGGLAGMAVTGNEGFVDWLKETITKIIEAVKSFFKWLFGMSSSKSEKMSKTLDHLTKNEGSIVAKSGELKYPAMYGYLWGNTNNVPKDLKWAIKAAGSLESNIDQCEKYIAATREFINGVSKLTPEQVDTAITDYHNVVNKIFVAETSFTPGTKIKYDGNFLTHVADVPRDKDDKFFETNSLDLKSLVKALNKTNTKQQTMLDKLGNLESNFIKELEAIKNANASFKEDNAEHRKAAKAILEQIRGSVSSLKFLVQSIGIAISSGLEIVNVALDKD